MDLKLDEIRPLTRISEGRAKQLKEACVWALDHCSHPNGVPLRIENSGASEHRNITWLDEDIDIPSIRLSYNQDDATEYGAEAVALLLSVKEFGCDAVERSMTKTGIDYWLGTVGEDENKPFNRTRRLEISGIMRESSSNKVSSRLTDKIKQTYPTDFHSPVYVVIVEFSNPYATVHLKK